MNDKFKLKELEDYIFKNIKLSRINKYSCIRKLIFKYLVVVYPKPVEPTKEYIQLSLFDNGL